MIIATYHCTIFRNHGLQFINNTIICTLSLNYAIHVLSYNRNSTNLAPCQCYIYRTLRRKAYIVVTIMYKQFMHDHRITYLQLVSQISYCYNIYESNPQCVWVYVHATILVSFIFVMYIIIKNMRRNYEMHS